jgi:formamidopyrimidine-DNA glycosylase
MINRMPRLGERLIYHNPSGNDEKYTVHSHFRIDGILNIQHEETGKITQIIPLFAKGDFNKLLDFNTESEA